MEREEGRSAGDGWAHGARFAWTERDGPGRAPSAPGAATVGSLGAVLLGTSIAMLVTDTLCPEHRAVVVALGVVAVGGSIASGIALLAGRPFAPSFALLSALCGMAIGVIDMLHVPVRGLLLTTLFGIAAALALWMVWRAAEAEAWSRRVDEHLAPVYVPELPPTGVVDPTPGRSDRAAEAMRPADPDRAVAPVVPEQVVARRRRP